MTVTGKDSDAQIGWVETIPYNKGAFLPYQSRKEVIFYTRTSKDGLLDWSKVVAKVIWNFDTSSESLQETNDGFLWLRWSEFPHNSIELRLHRGLHFDNNPVGKKALSIVQEYARKI